MRVSVFRAFAAGASDRNLAILAETPTPPSTRGSSPRPTAGSPSVSTHSEAERQVEVEAGAKAEAERQAESERHHYQSVLNSCRKRRAWQEAASTIAEMRARGVTVDGYHISAAMTICTKADEWRASLRIFGEWADDGTHEPDMTCYNAALAACVSAGRREEALALIARMDGGVLKPTAGCFTAAAKACMMAGDEDAALACFDELTRRGLPAAPADYHVAISAALASGSHARVATLAWEASRLLRSQAKFEGATKAESEGATTRPIASRPAAATLGARVGALSVEWCWSAWSSAWLLLLRDALEQRLPPSEQSAGRELDRSLTRALKLGEMPSFGSSSARSAYALSHLPTRVMKLAEILRLDAPAWLRTAVRETLSEAEAVVSLAAGPGFDAAALALALSFEDDMRGGEPLIVRAYDYEAGWEEQCDALAGALRACNNCGASTPLSLAVAQCDVTLSLREAPVNCALRDDLASARLVLASYCVAENAIALRRGDFVFFEELMADAAPGTLLIILEATHRQFPGIVAAARRGVAFSGCALDVACPWVASNKGFSLCLLKRSCDSDGDECSGRVQEVVATRAAEAAHVELLLERFERDDLSSRLSM